jgi:3'-5' exoribonuclease
LLYAGIILHDIGKLQELYTDSTVTATDYTIEGELLGHIIIGIRILEEHAQTLDIEKKLILEHMILSHHQNPEWGSPVRPMTPEAEMLHHLDMIDARMYDFKKATEQVHAGLMSERVYTLNNRKVYKSLD